MRQMNSFIRLVLTIAVIMTSMAGFAQERSMDEVMRIAQNHLQNRATRTGKRAASPTETATTIRSSQLFPTALRMNNTEAFYVLSYPKSHCFVMVSGDERMTPVLAYSDEHGFDFDNMAPQTKEFIQSYVKRNQALQTVHKLSFKPAPTKRAPSYVAPLLTTQWSQSTPYNNQCPMIGFSRTLTGCVATAMGQIMNYYKYPEKGTGTKEYTTLTAGIPISIVYDSISFDWDNMIDTYSGYYTPAQAEAVSNLLYAAGTSVEMNYGIDASGSDLGNAATSLTTNFGFDNDIVDLKFERITSNLFHELVQKELQEGRPVPCSGESDKGEGHAYIIDGMTPDEDNEPFYHINWGWNGLNDGEFKLMETEYHNISTILLYCQPENDSIDCSFFFQCKSVKPASSKINPEMANSIVITLEDLYNAKQGSFNGTLEVYLVNQEGNRTNIGERGVTLTHPYFYPQVEVNCKVPKGMELGEYAIEVCAVDMESSASEVTIYYAETQPLIITDENVDYTPTLGVTDMQFVRKEMNDDKTVSVVLKNLMNLAAEPFTGELSLALATESNRMLCLLGEPYAFTSQLWQFYYESETGNIKGELPDSLADDYYHIIVMARQDKFENWSAVTKYDLSDGYIQNFGQDLFLTIQIEDGKLKTDGIVVPEKFFADIETTEMILNEDKCQDRFVSITLTNQANLGSDTFSGSLSLALADDDNEIILTFGPPFSLSNLGHYQIRGNAITLDGELPDTLQDGHYRLCTAAQQKDFTNWTAITQFTLDNGYLGETHLPYFYDLWIIDGTPTFKLYTKEDVNHDGVVDTQDVLAIYLFMQTSSGAEENPLEDVNGDGVVDTQDVLTIYNYMQEN